MYNSRPPFRPPGLPPFPPNLGPGGGPPVLPPFPPSNVRPPFPPNFAPLANSPLPVRPISSPAPTFVKETKPTSVFVGGIAPGISDAALRNLLNACGPLRELKRVSGANGKPQAFGFALFDDPNVVMRCIRCLNGVELPDAKGPKALVVKVDDKTKGFLDEFEQTVGRTEEDEEADATARKTIAHIVARLIDPNAVAPPGISKLNEPFNVIVPAHLQDLKEGDLPENQRVAVLDQIAVFREAAARKEREKKTIEKEPANSDYGYGNRSLPRAQGFEPVPFVRAKAPEAKVESSRTDQEEEELRLARKARERDHALRDRERKVEHRERLRIDALNRELAYRQQQADAAANHRTRLGDRLEAWDDDRTKDPFLLDRDRWRAQRQPARAREYEDDVRDRQVEREQAQRIEKESEAFLERQMQELSAIEAKEDKGLLSEDAKPIRLALSRAEAAPVAAPRAGVTFDADDDEAKARPKTFVKLDDVDAKVGMSAAERAALQNAQLLEIRATIPTERSALFTLPVDVDETVLAKKLVPFINSRLLDYLGEADADVVDVILEAIRSKMSAADMIDEFEGPLGDEAGVLVEQLWRQLAFESAALTAKLDTGSMSA